MNDANLWQTELLSPHFRLRPLQESDFERLHMAASDPLIWEQHPDPERYKVETFRPFFDSGIKSRGAFVIEDRATGEAVGSSRYTEYSKENSSVEIGYTFLVRKLWGGAFNRELKTVMLDHALQHVDKAYFVVGKNNQRSRGAMTKIGGVLVENLAELPRDVDPNVSVVFKIDRARYSTSELARRRD